MKRYLTKLVGTKVFGGGGSSSIDPKYCSYEEDHIEMILDNTEYHINSPNILPNGMLMLYCQNGDESLDTNIMILKDWKTELVEDIISDTTYEMLRNSFTARPFRGSWRVQIPKELQAVLGIEFPSKTY